MRSGRNSRDGGRRSEAVVPVGDYRGSMEW